MRKRLRKYIASFDYFDKSLTLLSIKTGSISIASFATVFGAPVRIVSASFNLAFSISTGITKKKKKKLVMSPRSKLSRIESKISKALINKDIEHEQKEKK